MSDDRGGQEIGAATVVTGARRHLLGISLEDYFHVGAFRRLIDRSQWHRFEGRLERATLRTLDLLDEYQARATFFTMGWVADRFPELLREVEARGHEIGNSGFEHRGVRELSTAELLAELERGRVALESATGTRVDGVRVPDWLRPRDLGLLDQLAEAGYLYDASLRPLGLDLLGAEFKRRPFVHEWEGREIWEFPVPTIRLGGLLVPVGGGNAFRQIPHALIRYAASRWHRADRAPFAMYFQVWELDPDQPRITAASWLSRMRHYRNLDAMQAMVRGFLAQWRFTGFRDYLGVARRPAAAPAPVQRDRVEVRDHAPVAPAKSRTPVSVVVPCYNESVALRYLLNTLAQVQARLADRYQLQYVFVDDGSQDDTWEVLQRLVGHRADCLTIRHTENRGVADAILTGLVAAPTELVCSIDADCTYDPQQLESILPPLVDGAALVTASPYHPEGRVRNVPEWRLVLSRTLSHIYRRVLGSQLHTYTSCVRGYRRSYFVDMHLEHRGFLGVAETMGRALLAGMRVEEVPATLDVRLIGHSKLKVLRVIVGHLRLIADLLRWRRSGAVHPVVNVPSDRQAVPPEVSLHA